jgi:hypothetical protein
MPYDRNGPPVVVHAWVIEIPPGVEHGEDDIDDNIIGQPMITEGGMLVARQAVAVFDPGEGP